MNLIIPYRQDIENNYISVFIKPTGELIYNEFLTHIELAKKICRGDYYEYYYNVKYRFTDPAHFETYKKQFNYNGEKKDMDEFISSELSKEQLQLYKKWLNFYGSKSSDLDADFLVLLLGYDKLETIKKKCITTTSTKPHIRFYNYYLMDWDIKEMPTLYFSETENTFKTNFESNLLDFHQDEEAREEIEEIKSKTLRKERFLFFK